MAGKNEKRIITLSHGAGGEESRKMIAEMILPRFGNPYLDPLGDSAVIDLDSGTRIAFTTDSYTIDPIFFPDSDIGFLAVCGTVNDLAMSGAVPMFISAGLIIEEGFSVKDLDRVLDSMAEAACVAGVRLVTGDTKVVARGAADKIFINTAGLGVIPERIDIAPENCRAGDSVIVSGPVGSHGMAVVVARENFGLESSLKSDVAPVGGQVKVLLDACPGVRMMRDPTRGGLAGVLNEIAERIGLGVELEEKSIPVLDAVRQGCEILGFEPLFLANEGVFVTVLPVGDTERALSVLRENGAPEAALIGSLVEDELKTVTLNTLVGGRRVVIPMGGELLPRIC